MRNPKQYDYDEGLKPLIRGGIKGCLEYLQAILSLDGSHKTLADKLGVPSGMIHDAHTNDGGTWRTMEAIFAGIVLLMEERSPLNFAIDAGRFDLIKPMSEWLQKLDKERGDKYRLLMVRLAELDRQDAEAAREKLSTNCGQVGDKGEL